MRILTLALLCFCYITSFAQPTYLLHRSYKDQYQHLDSLMMGAYEQAMAKIATAKKWAEENGEQELAAHLEITRLLRTMRDNNGTVHEAELQELAIAARQNKYAYVEARAIQAIGDYYSINRKFAHSVQNYLTAYQVYSHFPAEEFPNKGQFLYEFGGAYYSYGDIERSVQLFREATAAVAPGDPRINTFYNSLGVSYRRVGKYDSALLFLNKVYASATQRNDSAWIGIASGNIGITYFLQQRYDEAIPLLEKDIALSIATVQIQNAASSLEYLSAIYYLRKDYNSAERLLLEALAISEGRGFWPNYQLAERIYGRLYRVYAAKGDMRRAYLYADSTVIAKDSVTAIYNALNLAKAVEKADLDQQQLEAEQLAGQRALQTMVRNSLITGILLVTVIGILLLNRQRLRQKKLEVEKKNAEHELNLAAKQLLNFRESVEEKNTLIEQYSAELERLKQAPATQTDEEVLTQLERAIILTDEQWDQFRTLFEKVHKNFFVNLKKKLPDLTQAEVRFLTLTKLKLSSKEMAAMLGISTNAIRIYRHRLRKKIGLDKDDMIEELVDNI